MEQVYCKMTMSLKPVLSLDFLVRRDPLLDTFSTGFSHVVSHSWFASVYCASYV